MTASSIIEYIDQYDGDVRQRLLTVYELIRSAVPDEAVESISWRMPTFKLGRPRSSRPRSNWAVNLARQLQRTDLSALVEGWRFTAQGLRDSYDGRF